ncbi:MAG: tyrosine-type recombinase/integrase [Dehalococcoidia bacterium]
MVEQRFRNRQSTFNLLNKLSVSQIAELSKLSKAYISQVKNQRRPPSPKLIQILAEYAKPQKPGHDYYQLFMQSRLAKEVSPNTTRFYQVKLEKFLDEIDVDKAKQQHIEKFLLQFSNAGNRHGYYQVIKTFYIWREQNFGLSNPIKYLPAPKVGKLILPSLTYEQVILLLDNAENNRDQAIISLFTESVLRLTELANIKPCDINWEGRCIRVLGKGRKEALAPFGALSEKYLKQWLSEYCCNGNIWGVNQWGITSIFRRLEAKTGITCNPHTFRRTFAVLLRKAGIDTMTIKELGRWESLEMVQRYTRSFSFTDSMKFYKAPLSNQSQ